MNRRVCTLAAGILPVSLLLVISACGSSIASAVAPVTTTVTTTAVPAAVTVVLKVTETVAQPEQTIRLTVTAPSPVPATAFRDGQHLVGRDIQPGTYRASSGSDICFWERKDEAGDVIANAFGTVATVRAGDFTFESNRCGTWTRVD